jgi:protein TonB
MLMPTHDIVSARPSGMSSRRAMTLGSVGLLHAVAIYALVSGMAPQITKYIPPVLNVDVLETKTQPKPVPTPPRPKLAQPTQPTLPTITPPVIDIATNDAPPITATPTRPNTTPVADSGASGIINTHTTPPYPTLARAASHQGTVLLQMTVSPQGDVVSANVVQSSGYPELDQAAVSWVVAHWKYRPAVLNGVTVTSQTQAAVKFDLKQAKR